MVGCSTGSSTTKRDLIVPWKVQVLNGGKIMMALASFDLNSKGEFALNQQALSASTRTEHWTRASLATESPS